jgi:hypothetical protein
MALVRKRGSPTLAVDPTGWRAGYFEPIAGSFANHMLDVPDDPPPPNPQ